MLLAGAEDGRPRSPALSERSRVDRSLNATVPLQQRGEFVYALAALLDGRRVGVWPDQLVQDSVVGIDGDAIWCAPCRAGREAVGWSFGSWQPSCSGVLGDLAGEYVDADLLEVGQDAAVAEQLVDVVVVPRSDRPTLIVAFGRSVVKEHEFLGERANWIENKNAQGGRLGKVCG